MKRRREVKVLTPVVVEANTLSNQDTKMASVVLAGTALVKF